MRKFQNFSSRAAPIAAWQKSPEHLPRAEVGDGNSSDGDLDENRSRLLVCLTAFSTTAADDASKQHATDFASKAAMSNLFEIEAAKIEIAGGKADDAKQFTQDMIRDHGKAGPVLNDAAKKDGIELPAALDAEYTAKLAALRQSGAANLDQAYVSTQATGAIQSRGRMGSSNGRLQRSCRTFECI
jgi:putative membrane protein